MISVEKRGDFYQVWDDNVDEQTGKKIDILLDSYGKILIIDWELNEVDSEGEYVQSLSRMREDMEMDYKNEIEKHIPTGVTMAFNILFKCKKV